MAKSRTHYALVTASAALALTLDAMPAAAYQQLSREVLVYRSPAAADDLPAPPSNFAGAPEKALGGPVTKTLGGPDTKVLGGPDTKASLRGYDKAHRLAR